MDRQTTKSRVEKEEDEERHPYQQPGVARSTMGIRHSNSQYAASNSLGLRAPPDSSSNSHISTPENASISGDSKAASYKSTGMGIVSRLRRLSSAALHGKVNRLFSRSNNPSQDSLLISGPISPTASTAAYPSSSTSSPAIPPAMVGAAPEHNNNNRSMVSKTRRDGHAIPVGSAETKKPVASRRNRAQTELTPLAINSRLESLDENGPATESRNPQSKAKATNSPLVASPLSQKSYHTLNANASNTEDDNNDNNRNGSASSHNSQGWKATTIATSSAAAASNKHGYSSPQLNRSRSHNHNYHHHSNSTLSIAERRRPPITPHRLSYEYSRSDYAHHTSSPPEKNVNRSPKSQHLSGGSNESSLTTPTLQRRRTALATVDWAGGAGPNSATSTDNHSNMLLSAFQPRSRGSEDNRHHRYTPVTSSTPSPRSAVSVTSNNQSPSSWMSAVSNISGEDDFMERRQDGGYLTLSAVQARRTSSGNSSGLDTTASSAGSVASIPALVDYSNTGQHILYYPPPLFEWKRVSHGNGRSALDNGTIPIRDNETLSISALGDGHQIDDFAEEEAPSTLTTAQNQAYHRVTSMPASLTATGPPPSHIFAENTPQQRVDYSYATANRGNSSNNISSMYAATSLPSTPTSQPIRPRGASHSGHLARTATTNAIRLKERNFSRSNDSSSNAPSVASLSVSPGSAPEPSNMELGIGGSNNNKAVPRTRAASATHTHSQPSSVPSDYAVATGYIVADGQPPSSSIGCSNDSSTATSQSQLNTMGRTNLASNSAAATYGSRPSSSMSAYTMSPISSNPGDDPQYYLNPHQHLLLSHMWHHQHHQQQQHQSSANATAGVSPNETLSSEISLSSSLQHPQSHHGNSMFASGMHASSSTSSPPVHYNLHGVSSSQLPSSSGTNTHLHHRPNTTTMAPAATQRSISSGISELLEPTSVGMARKDALWQVLVVSKSRADTEIDKVMKQWKETENGVIVCSLDSGSKPSLGDDDAMILKVKRGHRRSSSDVKKRSDGEKNEFRRRALDLAMLIRNSSVSELSNRHYTGSVTEQLYGLLTEQRTRFPTDANIGTLILDVLYQFSAVSQTVSQLAASVNTFPVGIRSIASGDASPTVSQFPSPQLAPDSSLGRGTLSSIVSISSALSPSYDLGSAGRLPPSRYSGKPPTTGSREGSAFTMGVEVNEHKIARTASESIPRSSHHHHQYSTNSDTILASGSVGRARPPFEGSGSHFSSPRLLPDTANSSTTSLLSLSAIGHENNRGMTNASGSSGKGKETEEGVDGNNNPIHCLHQSQRDIYFPQLLGTPHSSRLSVDMQDSDSDGGPTRQSMDEPRTQSRLGRHSSKLSMSSDATDSNIPSYKSTARASLQPHQFYPYQKRQQQPTKPSISKINEQQQQQQQPPPVDAISDKSMGIAASKRSHRPASMHISANRFNSLRRVSGPTSRQEKLARLLDTDNDDFLDSMPTSPNEIPSRPLFEPFESKEALTTPLPTRQQTETLGTIPESKLGSDVDINDIDRRLQGLAVAEQPLSSNKNLDNPVVTTSPASDAKPIVVGVGSKTTDAGTVEPETSTPQDTMVVCRLCDREFHRSVLNAHSDVCILEQTRAMKLEEVNQRIKRLRESISKRLVDLKKKRQWDKLAIRESERIIRIADRSLVWPEGDTQHDQIVAKSKFAKYIEKLQTITGGGGDVENGTAAAAATAVTEMPKADIETIWLAKRLLAQINVKCTIIEEFDKEFERLERQEALVREAKSLNTEEEVVPPEPSSGYLYPPGLPTWTQLTQQQGVRRSPEASTRTSIDYPQSYSESGSATPDVGSTPVLSAFGKRPSTLTRRRSRSRHHTSKPSQRSVSRSRRAGSEHTTESTETQSNSGSRKFVSLFAALFRNNNQFGGGAVLRRKNTANNTSNSTSKSTSNILRRQSQNAPAIPKTKTPSSSAFIPNPIVTNIDKQKLGGTEAPSSANTIIAPTSPIEGAPLSSPGSRQRNNSQLSTSRGGGDTTPVKTTGAAAAAARMPSIEDFDFVKPISRGAFGRVYLTRKKATKDLYAIKVMRKRDMINKNMVTQALAERRALSLLSTEWVVQLYYAFHSSKHLFLVMEYLVGGDLAGLLRVWGVMEEDSSRFYIAEIGCAIDYLHRNSIVHRDIKPDNVILASDGHIKLTDFGLSQVAVQGGADGKQMFDDGVSQDSPTSDTTPISEGAVKQQTLKADDYWSAKLGISPKIRASETQTTPPPASSNHSAAIKALPQSKRAHIRKSSRGLLGTPDYLAPELLLGAGNGFAVDWWALGVCLFEFLCGYPPFTDESPEAIFRNILNHAIDWPDEEGYVSQEATDLINLLLCPDPNQRGHWKNIKEAAFFDGWDMSNVRAMEPPFVPRPDDDIDTSYFESCQRKETQRLSNATFLQIDSSVKRPPPPPPLPLHQQLHQKKQIQQQKEVNMADNSDSKLESEELSHAHGSFVKPVKPKHKDEVVLTALEDVEHAPPTSSVGQLKKLFSGDSTDDEYVQIETSKSTASSSDQYSFTNDVEEIEQDDPEADVKGQQKLVDDEQGLRLHIETDSNSVDRSDSIKSTASEYEEDGSDEPDMSIVTVAKIEKVPLQLSTPVKKRKDMKSLVASASVLSTKSAVDLASSAGVNPRSSVRRKAINRTPSQHSDGANTPAVAANITHSRHASETAMQTVGKKSRDVQILDSKPEPSNLGLPMARSVSNDERSYGRDGAGGENTLRIVSPEVTVDDIDYQLQGYDPSNNDTNGDGDIEANNGIIDGKGDEEANNENVDSEKAFDDYTYKNLTLLNSKNKGVSSSGSATPTVEQYLPSVPAQSDPLDIVTETDHSRAPVYRSVSSDTTRSSPINAYDVAKQLQSQ